MPAHCHASLPGWTLSPLEWRAKINALSRLSLWVMVSCPHNGRNNEGTPEESFSWGHQIALQNWQSRGNPCYSAWRRSAGLLTLYLLRGSTPSTSTSPDWCLLWHPYFSEDILNHLRSEYRNLLCSSQLCPLPTQHPSFCGHPRVQPHSGCFHTVLKSIRTILLFLFPPLEEIQQMAFSSVAHGSVPLYWISSLARLS